jgi:hypothetical protein
MSKRRIFTSESCRRLCDAAASLPLQLNPLRLIALSLILILIAPPAAPAQSLARRVRIAPQIAGNCFSTNTSNIIPTPCLPDLGIYSKASSILQFQQQSLADFLSTNGLPTDQTAFYKMAGRSLRDEVRAFMYLKLQTIITEQPSQRMPYEQDVYDWYEAWMTHFEVQLYNTAHTEYLKYQYDPCHYTIDPTLQQTFGIALDTSNCSNLGSTFLPPHQPSAEYYKAVGYEKSFGALGTDSGVANTLEHVGALAQLWANAGPIGAAAVATPVMLGFKYIAPFAGRAILITAADGSEIAGSAFTAGAAGAGVFSIVAVALEILIEGAIDFSDTQAVIEGLNAFNNDFATKTAPGYQYNLAASNGDPEQQAKMMTVWSYLSSSSAETALSKVPDPSASLVISDGHLQPSPLEIEYALEGAGYLPLNLNADFVGSATRISDSTSSTDWEGRTWGISLYGDHYFLKTCIAPSIKLDSSGNPLYPCYGPELARTVETQFPNLVGSVFRPGLVGPTFYNALVSRVDSSHFNTTITGTSDDPTLYLSCPTNPTTGVSDMAGKIPACNGWVDTVAYIYDGGFDGNGGSNPDPTLAVIRRISAVQSPVFSSAPNVGFLVGQPQQFQVQASSPSEPGVALTYMSGQCDAFNDTPPAGVTFNSQGVLSYDGSNQPTGNQTFHVCAQLPNGPSAFQTMTITLGTQVGFVSPTQLTVYSGVPFSQKIYTSGYPPPSITVTNLAINDVLGFVHFQGNNDGSATVSGTIPYPFQLATALCIPASLLGPGTCPFVTATSVTGSVNAPFNVLAVTAPAPVPIIPPLTFISGIGNSILISTAPGSPTTPVLSALPPGAFVSRIPAAVSSDTSVKTPLAAAPWLTFQDNGNGTATLAGTPPVGTNASLGLELVCNAQWVIPNVVNLSVQVSDTPVFTNNPNAIFTVGVPGLTAVTTANPATITVGNAALPNGITTFGPAIGGIPGPLSAGYYPIPFTATNADGSVTQNLNVFVVAPPTVSLALQGAPSSLYLQAGATATIPVATTGFPKSRPDASWPKQLGGGMAINFTSNLPPGTYTFAGTTDPTGNPNGSGLLKFVPTAAQIGAYTATLSASNGASPDASLPLTITVVKAGDTNHDGSVDCSDLTIVRNALGKVAGQTGYNLAADINYDGFVDVRDFSFVSAHLPQGTVCH